MGSNQSSDSSCFKSKKKWKPKVGPGKEDVKSDLMLLKDEREKKREMELQSKQRKLMADHGIKDKVLYDLDKNKGDINFEYDELKEQILVFKKKYELVLSEKLIVSSLFNFLGHDQILRDDPQDSQEHLDLLPED
jgi:hypothetical protein